MTGAWHRVSIALGGGEARETADVLWLQADSLFADLRVNRSRGAVSACFAGTTTWTPPRLRWNHELDIHPDNATLDEGDMSWDGDLIERGVGVFPGITGPVPYVERWRRLADDHPARGQRLPHGVRVEAGSHALAVRQDGATIVATYDRMTAGGWRTERSFSIPQASRPPPLA